MEKFTINISKDFSSMLGGRWKRLGEWSGEEFYESKLEPQYLEALKKNEKLHIYLEGASPYGSSFLDQSFGELYRKYREDVKTRIVFHAEALKWIVDYIKEEIWERY